VSIGYQRSQDPSTQDRHVHVAAMAAILQEVTRRESSARWDTTELRERARAAGLNEHEYTAITILCSKLDAEGPAFLDPFINSGW
jgi:hypothetical protein